MTPIQEVVDRFLQKITDYNILKLSEEDLKIEFKQTLKSAIAKFRTSNKITIEGENFNRELEDLEMEILALGMVLGWIEPQINSIDLFRQRLSSKDFQLHSQANHLKELRLIKEMTLSDFTYWSIRYSSEKTIERLMKK